MSSGSAETIAAIATPPGKGALGLLRVSGPDTARIAAALLGRLPEPRRVTLASLRAADGSVIDEVLAVFFQAPASFSGEDMLELHAHGGPVVLDDLLQRLGELGCRPARPGEFSERAFVNGRIDIAQAEAVADLIDAATSAAARAAVRSLQGAFSARIQELQEALTDLRMRLEATIDFPDEDIDALGDGLLRTRFAHLFDSFAALAATARQGTLLRDGLAVVIAGKPNAGKSSLMNALAGNDVAIVTAIPGTTRDVLRERIEIDGLPLHLVDTAGLRAAADPIEAEGIRRAGDQIARADHILYVVDATSEAGAQLLRGRREALAAELAALPAGIAVTIVLNKTDLVGAAGNDATGQGDRMAATPPCIAISAQSGEGIAALREHLKSVAGFSGADGGTLSARRRHLEALAVARGHVERGHAALCDGQPGELVAEDLRLAQRALGGITGEFTSEDLLSRIFASFCIGK